MKCLLIVFKNLPLKIINLLPVLLNSDELKIKKNTETNREIFFKTTYIQ